MATIVTQPNLTEYFQHEVKRALFSQNVQTSDHVEYYLVNLLSAYSSQDFCSISNDKPLAILFLQSVQNENSCERFVTLKKVADFTLFLAGYFSDSLTRKLVDLDYYMSLGANAYSLLSKPNAAPSVHETFAELACQFPRYVDVISEISENAGLTRNEDLLRLYERYLKTGSQRLKDKLSSAGLNLNNHNLTEIH